MATQNAAYRTLRFPDAQHPLARFISRLRESIQTAALLEPGPR